MSTPTTFHAHGKDWFPHTPGHPMPVGGSVRVIILLRCDKSDNSSAAKASVFWWNSDADDRDTEIIGWRFATPAQEKDEQPKESFEQALAMIGTYKAAWEESKAESARLREIVDACMKAMPCGNIATHTPDNLAGRISELAQSLATETLENEQLQDDLEYLASTRTPKIWRRLQIAEKSRDEFRQSHTAKFLENASMRTAIKEGHTALEKVYLAYCSTTADVEDCGIDNIARDALATLSPFTQPQ